jgi:hypothetical protein
MRTLTRSLLLAAAVSPLYAGNYSTPFLDATAPTVSSTVSFGGQNFVNQGLVGVGVFATNVIDGRGDTFGSFSSFKLDHTTWRKHANGSYSGTLYTLPDRGYNVAGLIAYPARIQQMGLTFTPDYTANNVSQTQMTLSLQRTITVTDFAGQITTAVDPIGATTLQGYNNVATAGGKFAIDGEGLAIRADGSFYISDEYGATVYHVSKTGQMLGLITPPQAILPAFSSSFPGYTTTTPGALAAQTGGRRDNQGMEAVDLTPDGRYLVTMLQSSTRQENPSTSNSADRLYTRLMVYDVSQTATPTSTVGHYLVELPTFDRDGTGGSADRAAAQSELVALSPTTFLVLTRDGNGNGSGDNGRPLVFKTVSLVTTTGATNLSGTQYETGYTAAASGLAGGPASGITAAQAVPFVNLLNPSQLARFGIDMNFAAEGGANPISVNSLGEKWEALTIVPVLDAAAPNDYFLMVGNDNDFLGTSVTMLGSAPSDATAGPSVADNPNRVLVYRVTLPGYVDPGLIISATNRAPVMASKSLHSIQGMGTSFGSILKSRLTSSMRLSAPKIASDFDWQMAEQTSELCASGLPLTHGVKGGLRWWFDGSIRNISEDAGVLTPALDSRSNAGAVGLEWEVGTGFVLGLGIGMQDGKSEGSDGSNIGYTGKSVTSYLIGRGDVFFGSFTVTAGTQDFDTIQSAGPYGSTPSGATEGQSLSAEFVLGATVAEVGGWAVIPMVGLSRTTARVDGYSEAGIGGVTYPTQRLSTNTASASVELAKAFEITNGSYTPFARVGFDHDFGGKDQTSNVSVSTNGGTVGVAMTLPNADRDYAVGTLGMRWKLGEMNAEASYEYRAGDNGYAENRFNLSLSSSF